MSQILAPSIVTFLYGPLLILCSCKSIPFQPATYEKDYLTIGSGGGFAGIEKRYHVLPDGQVYHDGGLDSILIKQSSIPGKVARQALSNSITFGLDTYKYQMPDNTYKFLEVHSNGISNRIVWHRDDPKVSEICKQIYESINSLINVE